MIFLHPQVVMRLGLIDMVNMFAAQGHSIGYKTSKAGRVMMVLQPLTITERAYLDGKTVYLDNVAKYLPPDLTANGKDNV